MAPHDTGKSSERILGMQENISRRDFLNSALLASGAALASGACPIQLMAAPDWNGYGGVGDYVNSNGNTHDVMAAGHQIRDNVFQRNPNPDVTETGETFDCVVLGAGISGLAAALFLKRQAGKSRTCLILDNHAIFGGEAKRNEFPIPGQHLIAHQASAMWFPPLAGSFLKRFYDSVGIDLRQFHYQQSSGVPTGNTPYADTGQNFGFFFGSQFGHPEGLWLTDPFGKKLDGAPIPAATKAELLNMQLSGARKTPERHGDSLSRHLDSITLEDDLIEQHGLSRQTIRTFLADAGSGSGLGADALSAYCDYAADVLFPWDKSHGPQMFPDGNSGIARHIVKALIPNAMQGDSTLAGICQSSVNFAELDRSGQSMRIRLQSTVIAVQHDGEPARSHRVRIVYSRASKLYSVYARSVIMAGGSWTVNSIVRDLPSNYRHAYAQFFRAPCLVANVAVRNWRFLARLGISQCQWFGGIGNSMAVRRVATFGGAAPVLSPDSPTVLTLKILYRNPGKPLVEQVNTGRWQMMTTPFSTYEKQIREQLTAMFARTGFDARRDIAGIILNRWGHAYLSPQPGFFFGRDGKPAPAELMRKQPFGRIAFANTDLSGIMDHRASITEARRAVRQIMGHALR